MKYRKLRITFSAVCGIACLLLIVLWVRSYGNGDTVYVYPSTSTGYGATSLRGWIKFGWFTPHPTETREFKFRSHPSEYAMGMYGEFFEAKQNRLGFGLHTHPKSFAVMAPDWFVLLTMVLLAISPWLGWSTRFSLRTLLITTTVLALILGTIIATTR